VIGVFDRKALVPMGHVLRSSGTKRALLVHGHDGMDELTVTGPTLVFELRDGRLTRRTLAPERVGLKRWPLAALRGGDPAANARVAREVLEGKKGAARDIVLFNAGAALWVGGEARTLREGVAAAADSIDRGLAARTLESLTRRCAGLVRGAGARGSSPADLNNDGISGQ
jgi:anthranilate phosphoribosyltransferase